MLKSVKATIRAAIRSAKKDAWTAEDALRLQRLIAKTNKYLQE